MDAARQAWLAAHPWLAPLSQLHELVDEAVARAPLPAPAIPVDAWAPEHAAGVPLLQAAAGREVGEAAAAALGAVVDRIARAAVPGKTGIACQELHQALVAPGALERAAVWCFALTPPSPAGAGGEAAGEGARVAGSRLGAPPPHLGLARLLGWTALRRLLAATVAQAAPLRSAERWGHAHCPTCGARPGLAHLTEEEGARTRKLACGCCGTRWPWRRIGCPFCGNEAPDRLGVLEGDGAVRLDVCEGCKGYLKTCVTDGEAELFLADWPTLHLDLAARNHGFERIGASLYEL
jgi:FdhE protein